MSRLVAALQMGYATSAMSVLLAGGALAQGTDVSGGVLDLSTGQPVAGAVIDLASATRHFTTRSDEAGEFFLRNVDLGTYRATVRRIGYSQMIRDLDVVSGIRRVTLRISPIPQALSEVRVRGEGTGIYGQIARSGDLEPIVHAQVFAAGTHDSVFTDSTGTYYIRLERPGSYMVRVRAPGYLDDMFILEVKRDHVGDGSRLLDIGNGNRIPPGMWKDFDRRLAWTDVNKSLLMPGSDVRRAGTTITGALQQSGMMVGRGMKLGPTVCIFVNGTPRPGYPLDMIRPEEVAAMEVYGNGADPVKLLMTDWPVHAPCSETGERARYGPVKVTAIVIWTK
jgi:hypothetical protein